MSEFPFSKVLPAAIGIAFTAIFLIGLAHLANVRKKAQLLPTLRILAPLDGDVADSPLVVEFVAPGLVLRSTGWGAGSAHIHAAVDTVELMPAARDIRPLSDSTFAWTLTPVTRGRHALRLLWSGPMHERLERGLSESRHVEVR